MSFEPNIQLAGGAEKNNAGELDTKIRRYTIAQIIGDPNISGLFLKGQEIILADGTKMCSKVDNPTSEGDFEPAPKKEDIDAINNRIPEDLEEIDLKIVDSIGQILAIIGKYGIGARQFNIKNQTGSTIHTLNKEFMEAVTNLFTSIIVNSEEEGLSVLDSIGQILAEINKDGINARQFLVKNSEGDVELIINGNFADGIEVLDKNGLLLLKLDKNGLQARTFFNRVGEEVIPGTGETPANVLSSPLYGKKLVTVCDSLGVSNEFQAKLVALSGMAYNNAENNHATYPLSIGGTASIDAADDCGSMRIQNIENQGLNPDIIIYENVNDGNIWANLGTIDDAPFLLKNILQFVPDPLPYSKADADAYWTANYAAILTALDAQKAVGSVIKINYQSYSRTITFTGAASVDGTIVVNVNGTDYNIPVTTSMSVEDIATALGVFDFTPARKTVGDDWVNINSDDPTTITLDAAGTGVTATITGLNSWPGSISRYFKSLDIADWGDNTKWEAVCTIYSAYKGIVEYAQNTFPNARFIWFIPNLYNITLYGESGYDPTLWKDDGTFDMDAYKVWMAANSKYIPVVVPAVKAICERYNVEYYDMNDGGKDGSGITPFNMHSGGFYNLAANVHPKTEGYERWGETLYRLIK